MSTAGRLSDGGSGGAGNGNSRLGAPRSTTSSGWTSASWPRAVPTVETARKASRQARSVPIVRDEVLSQRDRSVDDQPDVFGEDLGARAAVQRVRLTNLDRL